MSSVRRKEKSLLTVTCVLAALVGAAIATKKLLNGLAAESAVADRGFG